VRVAIDKIEGVTSTTVSVNEGMTTEQFASSNSVRIEQIREVIRSNGFTPKEADVRVAGLLVHRGDTLALAIPGAEELFPLQDYPGVSGQLSVLRQFRPNERITITGQVPASQGRSAKPSRVLLVRSFVAGETGMNP
jgi:copper chaperone CopZ